MTDRRSRGPRQLYHLVKNQSLVITPNQVVLHDTRTRVHPLLSIQHVIIHYSLKGKKKTK